MEMYNHNPMIYLICGKARQGKDTISTIIRKIYEEKGLKTLNLQFTFYLKRYARNIANWDGSEETKPRILLQNLGVELIKQKIDDNMLIRRMIEDIKVYSYFYDVITIDDTRFPEEIEDVRNNFNNVIAIKVVRDENTSLREGRDHLTETALENYNNYDYVIHNDGSLEELEEKIYNLISEVNKDE